jgi:hypothetical protein
MVLKINHKAGGKITAITGIAHSTYQRRPEWHFVGKVEWNDRSHERDPDRLYDIHPAMLCLPEDGDDSDVNKALAALNEYLRINGDWLANGNGWAPHKPSGSVKVKL